MGGARGERITAADVGQCWMFSGGCCHTSGVCVQNWIALIGCRQGRCPLLQMSQTRVVSFSCPCTGMAESVVIPSRHQSARNATILRLAVIG